MKKVFLSGIYRISQDVTRLLNQNNLPSIIKSSDISNDENFIESETWNIYLMGACDIFATALNQKYGYPLYEIKDANKVIHYCCITTIDEETCYIDIRGITNMKQIFDIELKTHNISTNNIKKVSTIENNHSLYDELLKIASQIIEENEEWYNASLVKKI